MPIDLANFSVIKSMLEPVSSKALHRIGSALWLKMLSWAVTNRSWYSGSDGYVTGNSIAFEVVGFRSHCFLCCWVSDVGLGVNFRSLRGDESGVWLDDDGDDDWCFERSVCDCSLLLDRILTGWSYIWWRCLHMRHDRLAYWDTGCPSPRLLVHNDALLAASRRSLIDFALKTLHRQTSCGPLHTRHVIGICDAMQAWSRETCCRGRLRGSDVLTDGDSVRPPLPQLARFSKKANKCWYDGIFLLVTVDSHWLTVSVLIFEINNPITAVSSARIFQRA